ncbi:MAG: NUDIX hydrolase [Chloroflexi bacterium]|jgi:ADP-ribose pyrophosphatase YjhB (NUDIX family)|nr:NUDIX hydrolase [Chloroflexota bacterium]
MAVEALHFCSSCGGRLEPALRDGRTRAVCVSCGKTHYVNPIVAAGTLVNVRGQVLLVRRAVAPREGYWALPAGYAEVGEHPEETALRETLEESGVQAQLDGLLTIDTFGGEQEPFGVLLLYAAHADSVVTRPGDDASEACFFAPEQLPASIAFETHRRVLRRWAAEQRARSEAAP